MRHIVELHGDRVRAESAGQGQGATFIVDLPVTRERVKASEAEPIRRGSEDVISPALSSLAGVNVLVVDDDADARELLMTILHRAGAKAAVAASAAEALRTLQQSTVDVLVSDIGMPDDGYTLIRKVRELSQEKGGRIPAIAVTASARAEDRSRALAAGFQLHMAKPIDPAELTKVIAQMIDDRA